MGTTAAGIPLRPFYGPEDGTRDYATLADPERTCLPAAGCGRRMPGHADGSSASCPERARPRSSSP